MQVLKILKRDPLSPTPSGCTIILDTNVSQIDRKLIQTYCIDSISKSSSAIQKPTMSEVINPKKYPLGPVDSLDFCINLPGNNLLIISEYNLIPKNIEAVPVAPSWKKRLLLEEVEEEAQGLLHLVVDGVKDVKSQVEAVWKGDEFTGKRNAFLMMIEEVAAQGSKMRDKKNWKNKKI